MKTIISLLLIFQVNMSCFSQVLINKTHRDVIQKNTVKVNKFRLIADKKDFYDNITGTWNQYDSTHYTFIHNYTCREFTTMLWDVLFWTNNMRKEYTYDENFNVLSEEYQFWDGAEWAGFTKNVFTYNHENQVVSNTTLDFDNISGQWKLRGRMINEYNSNDELIVLMYQSATSGTWTNLFRDLYMYDDSSNLISSSYQQWDNSNNWKNFSKHEYTNNPLNLPVSDTSFSWNSGLSQWRYDKLSTFEYNPSGKQTRRFEFTWNSLSTLWENNFRWVSEYDANMNQLSYSVESWDNTLSQWIGTSKDLYTYDSAGNMISDIYQVWESTTSSWYSFSRVENTYDANNNRVLFTETRWDGAFWLNFYKRIYTYDANNNEILNEYFGWNSSSWTGIDRLFSYYESFDDHNSINEINTQKEAIIYPNPACSLITFKNDAHINSIDIFNFSGLKVFTSLPDQKMITLNVGNFQPGIYFVRLKTSDGIFNGKFSIAR